MNVPIRYTFRSLLQRRSRSALTVLGIASVIGLYVAMAGLRHGMATAFAATGSPDNVVLLQKGAFSQSLSSLPRNSRDVVRYLPHVLMRDGQPLVASELAIEPWVTVPGQRDEIFAVVRGVEPVFFQVEDTIRLVEGSAALTGNRVLVGRSAQQKLGGTGLGTQIRMFDETWTVGGIFEAGGTNLEALVLADLGDLMRAAKRDEYTSFTLKLDGAEHADAVIQLAENDRRVLLTASREKDYYRSSGGTFAIIGRIGLLISVIVTVAAVFGGMNTMYTAVSGRVREIGTLRALGFSRRSILVSFLAESMLLSVAGGLLGAALGYLVNGLQLSVTTASVRFAVGPGAALSGLLLSAAVGLAGGLLPARGAARLQIADAMRRS